MHSVEGDTEGVGEVVTVSDAVNDGVIVTVGVDDDEVAEIVTVGECEIVALAVALGVGDALDI